MGSLRGVIGNGCPACDSSVYSYCSHKMIHDACCCHGTVPPFVGPGFGGGQFGRPSYCRFQDCTFLEARSCKEHDLIVNCCCDDDYKRKKWNQTFKSFVFNLEFHDFYLFQYFIQ